MKILFISNIIGKRVGSFAMASIRAAHKLGLEYHMAANFLNCSPDQRRIDEEEYGIRIHHVDIMRNPAHIGNLKAYRQITELVKREKIDFIHCNTPIGGVLGRMAGQACGVKRIIYQAHGFHFYQGAPAINWTLYYPVEKQLARKTDALITINREDYERARKFRLRGNGTVYYVPGVGIDLSQYQFDTEKRALKRRELGLRDTDIAVITTGELISRKNYETAIKAIAETGDPRVHYFICGQGILHEKLERLAGDLAAESHIHFLGFRTDVILLLMAADIFLFTSFQEGLPRAVSEAMAVGLPCVASSIRGNTDLIEDGDNGFLYRPADAHGFSEGIRMLAGDPELRSRFSDRSRDRIKAFSLEEVTNAICSIYRNELFGEKTANGQ